MNKTIDRLVMASIVHWYGHVLRGLNGHVLRGENGHVLRGKNGHVLIEKN